MGGGGPLHVGTSGWSYPEWRSGFYAGVPQRRWLAHCAGRFTGIEVNATFYRRMKPSVVARWRDETPAGFAFAAKGHRLVTHVNRLRDVAEPLRRMREGVAPLGQKLRVVLWQLPAALTKDVALLRSFGEALATWPEARHAVELRHRSWFDDETAAALKAGGLANCISDAADWPRWEAVTADLVYLRLHGRQRTYASAYGRRGLRRWAGRVRGWLAEGRAVHVYFDNNVDGAAPADALTLIEMAGPGVPAGSPRR